MNAPTTPDPIEIAMQAEADGAAPSGVAARVLARQERLIGWQIAGERAGFGLKLLGGLAGLIVALALAAMAWQASRADGVVIEAFSAPPDLAARGLTGQVLASQLQDRLVRLQSATYSVRPEASLKSGFGDEIAVEIPSTGVSIGDLQRMLRAWLGHETRVTGELYRAPDGQLALTVRTTGQDGTEITAPEAALPDLLQRSAEALYARTQPYRYAMYLRDRGRFDDARRTLQALADGGPRSERAWALAGLSLLEPDRRTALALARQATQADPKLAEAWRARFEAGRRLQDDGETVTAGRRFMGLLNARGRGGYSERLADQGKYVEAWLAANQADALEARRLYLEVMAATTDPRLRDLARVAAANVCGNLHEPSCTRRLLGGAGAELEMRGGATMDGYLMPSANGALQIEDWAEVLRQAEAREAAVRANPGPISPEEELSANIRPAQIRALVFLGRLDEARALVPARADCQNCRQVRGLIAAAEGNRAATDYWYGEAVRHRAAAPGGLTRWGLVTHRLLRDPDGAIVHFREANKRAPKFADPLEAWGEALIDKKDFRGAAKKFERAQRLAPRWGRLHLYWGIALARQGKPTEARAKWQAALSMDLSPADRTHAQTLLARSKT